MIIGITGQKRSGKDTAFKLIKELYPDAERIGFADKLKEAASRLLNVGYDTLERFKEFEDRAQLYVINDTEAELPMVYSRLGVNIRQFLQRLGTEVGRDLFGNDFWIKQALPPDLYHANKLIVVTDVRFDNEAMWILNQFNGAIIEIQRPELNAGDGHASEQPISRELVDSIIVNDGTIDDLRKRVEECLSMWM